MLGKPLDLLIVLTYGGYGCKICKTTYLGTVAKHPIVHGQKSCTDRLVFKILNLVHLKILQMETNGLVGYALWAHNACVVVAHLHSALKIFQATQ